MNKKNAQELGKLLAKSFYRFESMDIRNKKGETTGQIEVNILDSFENTIATLTMNEDSFNAFAAGYFGY